jgi:2-polyprenyl-6-methoxyphenol hydroxylase-like FAD-dependent oxidoreductase
MSKNPLRVAIVGGGIGGVAAATALLQRGMEVRLYEQAPALAEVGAGVALQPNGARMLERLGLDHKLARFGARWVDSQFRRQDGSYAASMWPPELASRIEFYGLHRADLLATFVDRLPTQVVCTGHRCVAIEQVEEQATLTFANGAPAVADASSIASRLRPGRAGA